MKEVAMQIKRSVWYFVTDIILDMLVVAYLIFLAWHFAVVIQRGGVTVQEPTFWILCTEIYVLVPLVLLFGLWKLFEDIVLYYRKEMGHWHIATEFSLGIIFLAAMGFIAYHFLHIWRDGSSTITSENPWLVIGIITFCALLGIFKTWEDFHDLQKFKE